MEATLTAIELTGMIDEQHQLRLDDTLPIAGPKRVRVIVLYPLEGEWNETDWLHAAARNPAFEFLNACIRFSASYPLKIGVRLSSH